jgi:hypothetical protein
MMAHVRMMALWKKRIILKSSDDHFCIIEEAGNVWYFRVIERSWVLSITSQVSASVSDGVWDIYDTPEARDLMVFLPYLWSPLERFCSYPSPFWV